MRQQGLRRLSYSLHRRCSITYRKTVNKLNTHTDRHDEFSMKFCLLIMIIVLTFRLSVMQQSQQPQFLGDDVTYSGSGHERSFAVPVSNGVISNSLNSSHTMIDQLGKLAYSAVSVDAATVSTGGTKITSSKRNENRLFEVDSTVDTVIDGKPVDFKRAILLVLITVLAVVCLHLRQTLNAQICLASPQPVTWQLLFFRLLPLRSLSTLVGQLAQIHLPVLLRFICWTIFVRLFNVNIQEAQNEQLTSYESLQKLFQRRLKIGVRPININSTLVCPVDGTVMHVGAVTDNCVEQVKGVQYSLKAFLGRGVLPRYGRSDGVVLYTAVLYLSPGDYHHFHSPAEWTVHLYRHFPGELVTVSPWAVRHMPGLLALNERVLLSGQWEHGYFSLTAVGALNVGSIYLDNYKELQTNIRGHYKFNTYTDKHLGKVGERICRGDHLGGFNFGSTVVLIFEAPPNFQFMIQAGDRVKYGEPLGHNYCVSGRH